MGAITAEDKGKGIADSPVRRLRSSRPRSARVFIDDMAAATASQDDDDDAAGEEDSMDQEEQVNVPRKKKSTAVEEEVSMDIDEEDQEEEANVSRKKKKANEPADEVPEEICFWKIKCHSKISDENAVKAACARVEKANGSITIKCAMAVHYYPGFIFVEADNVADVKEACKLVKQKSGKTSMVPLSGHEMLDILRVETPIQAKDWVMYNGDLAKVLEVFPMKGKATIKRIPRVTIEELKHGQKRPGRKSKTDAPQKFITLEELTEMNIPVKRKRDPRRRELYIAGNMTFYHGYLLTSVSVSVLTTVSPSDDEIKKFKNVPRRKARDDSAARQLEKGDKIVVLKGRQEGRIGIFERLERTAVYVRIEGKEYSMHEGDIRKYFEVGTRVCIASGEHEGATGTVACVVDDEYVSLLTDVHESIQVSMDCIGPTSYVPLGRTKLGIYQLHDLVQVTDQQTFGMIVKLDRTGIQILKGIPDKVEQMMAKPMELSKIVDATMAQDCAGNIINLKDTVRVQSGVFKEKTGPVVHIHRGILFVHDVKYLECSGFFCVSAVSCFRCGGRNKPKDPTFNTGASVKPRRHPLERKKVMITRGVYKSYRGRVVRVFPTVAHVFLEANLKTVSAPIEHLKDLEPHIKVGEVAPTQNTNPVQVDVGGWDDNGGRTDGGWGDENQPADAGWGNDKESGGWGGASNGNEKESGGWGEANDGNEKESGRSGGWGEANEANETENGKSGDWGDTNEKENGKSGDSGEANDEPGAGMTDVPDAGGWGNAEATTGAEW